MTSTRHSRRLFILPVLLAFLPFLVYAQNMEKPQADHSYKPLILKLNDDGSKFLRLLMWHQIWASSTNMASGSNRFDMDLSVRRSRLLAYAQVSPKFLILTHFGLNNLDGANLTPTGNTGNGPQFFLHDAWTEFKVSEFLYIGAGIHYWNGLNRLASSSTLNFLTMDHTRPFLGWHSLGYTDQFGRHLGIYAKGEIGNFDYRFSVNEPVQNNFEAEKKAPVGVVTYNTAKMAPEKSGKVISGYLRYNLLDKESHKLPYEVGSYLGDKKVLGFGGGFFLHPNGTLHLAEDETYRFHDVRHFAFDVFLDMPLSTQTALTAYATYMHFDYGPNWVGRWSGTGAALYGHVGYFVRPLKIQSYIAYQFRNFEGQSKNGDTFDLGINYFISGHNAKLTLEYHRIGNDPANNGDLTQLRMQAHVFL